MLSLSGHQLVGSGFAYLLPLLPRLRQVGCWRLAGIGLRMPNSDINYKLWEMHAAERPDVQPCICILITEGLHVVPYQYQRSVSIIIHT